MIEKTDIELPEVFFLNAKETKQQAEDFEEICVSVYDWYMAQDDKDIALEKIRKAIDKVIND